MNEVNETAQTKKTLIDLFSNNLKELSIKYTKAIAKNDIVLDDIYVSHHHAVISPVRNLYQIEDLQSRNHTYINGNILNGKEFLQNGDVIKIGCVSFRFERWELW